MSAVRVSGLRKRFGAFEALRGMDLEVEPGVIYGLVGPNGAGKTTLFRILVGLMRADAGEVTVLGAPPGDRLARARTGYMTQSEALYGDLSAAANVRFFARLFGLRGEALDAAVAAALERVELTDRADHRVRELSGGMRRRVSLACATVHGPKLLLLDEPTVGVDPELRLKFWADFKEWTAAGTTLLISTHHIEETRHCDRLGFLRAGAMLAEGPPAELLEAVGAETLEDAFLAYARGSEG